jgi:hypothetical protein
VDPIFLAAALIRATVPPAEDVDPASGIGTIDVTIVSVPPVHQVYPDEMFRPSEEAEVLWRAHEALSKR